MCRLASKLARKTALLDAGSLYLLASRQLGRTSLRATLIARFRYLSPHQTESNV